MCLELAVVMRTTVPMHECALGICTNPTSDKGCSIWAMVGSAMATAPQQMTLYSCRGSVQVSLQLYNPSTWSTRRYTLPAEALQLYSPLQPSTALYSSTALHPLQYTTLYSTPQHGLLSSIRRSVFADLVGAAKGGRFNEGMFGVPLSGAHARFRVSVTNTRRSNVRTSCVYMYSKRGPGTDTDTSA